MHPAVERLLTLKSTTSEKGAGFRVDELNGYIDRLLAELKTTVAVLPQDEKHGWERLDELFLWALKVFD
jgi:hypothetical protein